MSAALTPIAEDDAIALNSLDAKLRIVRDLTTGVALGFQHGLYLWGSGGLGKSYNVLSQLKALAANHKLFNTRMTAKGLFQALHRAPDAIHLLEDMERITKDADAQGVLRSALWAQPGHERVITWTTSKEGEESFVFRGGIILISNRPLSDLPELRAMATRIETHRLDVSDAELAALMRKLAADGYRMHGKLVIEPCICLEITQFLLDECRSAGCQMDLRLQQKAFRTFLQFEADWSNCHWRDLVAASVREAAVHFRHEANDMPREQRRTQRRNILRHIMSQTTDSKQQLELYLQQTDASRADFFRRKREVETGDFDEHDVSA